MRRTSVSSIILVIVALLIATGCAGGGTAQAPNPFAGTYDGTSTLDSAKTGTLAISVDANGTASGTLTVTAAMAPHMETSGFVFPVGSHAFSGQVDNHG